MRPGKPPPGPRVAPLTTQTNRTDDNMQRDITMADGTTLPAEYYARCTDTGCTWEATVALQPDAKEYRDELAARHTARYGHTVQKTDYA